MRKIINEATECFLNAKKYNNSNTSVIVEPNVTMLSLYSTVIAYHYNDPERTLSIQTKGFNTNTTLNRLNALPGVSVRLKKGVMYLNDVEWDGKLIDIK